MPKIIPASLRAIIAHEKGPASEIAARHGVYFQTVERCRREHGIFGIRGRKTDQAAIARAVAMRRDGQSLKAIAAETGYSLASVWNWCENARVNPKSKTYLRTHETKTTVSLR